MLNHENLNKLADYLDTLPDDYEAFEMQTFFNSDDSNYDLEARYARGNAAVNSCGAVACAVGHGPSAGILVPDDLIDRRLVNWYLYVDRFFINGYYAADEGMPAAQAFVWMFSGDWSEFDNTPRGAAKRIRYLLNGGKIPTYRDDYYDVDEVKIDEESVALYQ